MTISRNQVRRFLDSDEPDYGEAAKLGPRVLPLLEQLVHGDDDLLAAKAVYLTGLLEGGAALRLLKAAVASQKPTLRMAAAAGLCNRNASEVGAETGALMADPDIGVQKHAIRSLAKSNTPTMRERVQRLALQNDDSFQRQVAIQALQER